MTVARYAIVGSSNGLVYDREKVLEREEALERCKELVTESVGTTAPLDAWVWDRTANKRIGHWWVDSRGKVREG